MQVSYKIDRRPRTAEGGPRVAGKLVCYNINVFAVFYPIQQPFFVNSRQIFREMSHFCKEQVSKIELEKCVTHRYGSARLNSAIRIYQRFYFLRGKFFVIKDNLIADCAFTDSRGWKECQLKYESILAKRKNFNSRLRMFFTRNYIETRKSQSNLHYD